MGYFYCCIRVLVVIGSVLCWCVFSRFLFVLLLCYVLIVAVPMSVIIFLCSYRGCSECSACPAGEEAESPYSCKQCRAG